MTASFEALCLPFRKDLLIYATKLCRNADTAQDVVQESMLKALQQWSSFHAGPEPERAARAWMYRIVHNTYMDVYRRGARRRDLREEYEADVRLATYGVPEDHTEHTETEYISDKVATALATLTEKQRTVIMLVDIQGQHYREVAAQLGVPHMTVTSRLHAARRQMEAQLGGLAAIDYGIRRPESTKPKRQRSARAREHAVALQPAKSPEAEANSIDGIVLGLDAG